MSDGEQIDYSLDVGEHRFVVYVSGRYEIMKSGERWLDTVDCFSMQGTTAIFGLISYVRALEKVHNPEPAKNPLVLHAALDAALKLQSHYALLLNSWDGGQRRQFESVEAWIDRLSVIAKIKQAGNEQALAQA